jgi:hypothetical protein
MIIVKESSNRLREDSAAKLGLKAALPVRDILKGQLNWNNPKEIGEFFSFFYDTLRSYVNEVANEYSNINEPRSPIAQAVQILKSAISQSTKIR